MLTYFFKDASFRPPPNLYSCNLVVENYRFSKCLGWRFSPILTFFSLLSSCAFTDAPHSRFRCRDPNQCLSNFLKMLLLALPQLSQTCISLVKNYRVTQCLGWRFSPISTFFSFVSSRAFRNEPHSDFKCRDLNQCSPNFDRRYF